MCEPLYILRVHFLAGHPPGLSSSTHLSHVLCTIMGVMSQEELEGPCPGLICVCCRWTGGRVLAHSPHTVHPIPAVAQGQVPHWPPHRLPPSLPSQAPVPGRPSWPGSSTNMRNTVPTTLRATCHPHLGRVSIPPSFWTHSASRRDKGLSRDDKTVGPQKLRHRHRPALCTWGALETCRLAPPE